MVFVTLVQNQTSSCPELPALSRVQRRSKQAESSGALRYDTPTFRSHTVNLQLPPIPRSSRSTLSRCVSNHNVQFSQSWEVRAAPPQPLLAHLPGAVLPEGEVSLKQGQ